MQRRGFAPKISVPAPLEDSYNVDDQGKFISQNLQVDDKGARIEDEDLGELACDFQLDELIKLETLGEGASGVVYKARNRRTGQLMAVKTFNIFDKSNRHQFIKELKTLNKANCPSLIRFYGAFYKEGQIAIAIELMDAGDLHNVLKMAGKFPEDMLACFAKQILIGLDYLKQNHKLHRDIKAGNVCVNSEGEAKLTDFGIATQLDTVNPLATTFLGSQPYMAPERIAGAAYSYPSDIWSIGIVFLECFEGKFPYPRFETMFEAISRIVQGPPPKPSDSASPEFKDFISKCLVGDPNERASAQQLLSHPFITKYSHINKEDTADTAAWIQGLLAARDGK